MTVRAGVPCPHCIKGSMFLEDQMHDEAELGVGSLAALNLMHLHLLYCGVMGTQAGEARIEDESAVPAVHRALADRADTT